MKKLCLYLLVICLLTPCAALAAPTVYEGAGCETPEKAVRLYLEGAKEGDLQKMLSAFAIETFVQHYDFEAQARSMRLYSFTQEIKFPNTNDLFMALNVEARKNAIAGMIMLQAWSLSWPEQDPFSPIPLKEEEDAEAFVAKLQAAETTVMQAHEFKMFIDPAVFNEKYNDPLNQENLQRRAAIAGADEIKSVVALLSIHEKGYALCCDAMRYGDKWYLSTFQGNITMLMNISPRYGGIMPIE